MKGKNFETIYSEQLIQEQMLISHLRWETILHGLSHLCMSYENCLCYRLSFHRYLYSKQPWEIEITFTSVANSRFVYSSGR